MFVFADLWTFALQLVQVALVYGAFVVVRHVVRHVLLTAPLVVVAPVPSDAASANERVVNAVQEMSDAKKRGLILCYDPGSMAKLGTLRAATEQDVKAQVERTRVAQAQWAQSSFGTRRKLMATLLRFITANQAEIVRVACQDSGKTRTDAAFGELLVTCEKLRWLIIEGEAALAPESRSSGIMNLHKSSEVCFVPVGVVGAIVPWNYPFHNVFNPLCAALFAGNGIVIKTSEQAAWSSQYYQAIIDACLDAVGAPRDLARIVVGYGEAGAALLSAPFAASDAAAARKPHTGDTQDLRAGGPRERGVDLLIFVGSVQVGQIVATNAAQSLTPCVLELGGKNPLIVCDDVDVESIVQLSLRGVLINAGQNCNGPERFLVYERVYEQFVSALTREFRKLKAGVTLTDDSIDLGAMRMPNAPAELEKRVAEAVASGARLICGGHALRRGSSFAATDDACAGQFFEPTLLVDVTDTMAIAQDEIFGPICCVMRVKNNSDDEAVRIANNCSFALGAGVLSNDAARAARIGHRVRSGMLSIDDIEGATYLSQSLPFGGPARSGGGRFGGVEGLRGLCYPRAVVRNRLSFLKASIPKPMQYPSTGQGGAFSQGLVRLLYGYSLLERIQGLIELIKAGNKKTKTD
jgi:acyl-CoA reductase-like NAD-dependent aldehyde dehydrogenase